MIDWFTHSPFALLGTGGTVLVALGAVAYFFPPFRKLCIEIGGILIAAMALYAKGVSDQSKSDKAKRDKMVGKVKEKYDEIDARPDDDRTVDERLRRGGF